MQLSYDMLGFVREVKEACLSEYDNSLLLRNMMIIFGMVMVHNEAAMVTK